MEYADGVYLRNSSNNGWQNFNDLNTVYKRNSSNNGWISGASKDSCAYIYRRNSGNNGWVQIYPKGIITADPPPLNVSSVNMSTKQKSYTSWKTGMARQGWCTKDGAGGEQIGIITCNSSSLPGAGGIIDNPTTVRFSGTLGASGNYNANQTISFRGCNYTGSTTSGGNPFANYNTKAPFTFSWKAGGTNSPIPEGNVTGGSDNLRDWLNNVNGFGQKICVYNGETNGAGSYESTYSANYLNITAFKLIVKGYTYMAKAVLFDRPESMPKMFSMSSTTPPKDDNYLNIALAENQVNLPVETILQMLDSGELQYRSGDEIMSFSEVDNYRPTVIGYENGTVQTSPLFSDAITVEYKLNDKWTDSICIAPDKFMVNKSASEIRLVDRSTMEVYYNLSL